MKINKRDFIVGTGFLGMAGLAGAAPASSPEKPGAQSPSVRAIHGVFLNNAEKYSPKEDSIVIDDCKIAGFSGHGARLLRIWLFIIRHSIMQDNKGCGVQITGWDGFVTDNQFSYNGSHGFGCDSVGCTVMFTANRVEWNRGYGLCLCGGCPGRAGWSGRW